MAPEAIERNRWSEKSDVWAFGVFFWEVLTMGAVPYQSYGIYKNDSDVQAGVCSGDLHLPQPPGCSNELYAIVMRCWEKRAAQRPTFKELRWMLQEAIINAASGSNVAGQPPLMPGDISNHVSLRPNSFPASLLCLSLSIIWKFSCGADKLALTLQMFLLLNSPTSVLQHY